MKKVIPFLIGLSLPFFAHAQNYSVQLPAGVFTPLQGIVQEHSGGEQVNNRYYRFIQFHTIPTTQQKKALETKGIRLLQYIPNNTYIASVSSAANLTAINDANIRSIFPIAAKYKLNELLAKKAYPAWALRGNGNIELTVLYHADIPQEQARQMLAAQTISFVHSLEELKGFRIIAAITDINTIAALPCVAFLEPADAAPKKENLVGRTDHRGNTLTAEYSSGLHFDGTGVKVALNDDGIIGPHIDYTGRIIGTYITNNNGNHGDHCAGTIFGGGNRNPTTRGMAFGAQLGVYGVGSAFANNYQAFDSISIHYNSVGTRITSTSYADGNNTGYTARARLMDQQIRNMPELIHVFSSGNEGTSNFNYGAGAGWGNVTGGAKQAKNVMTVGNVTYLDALANSSSRGPAKDGRIKPDVCAVGTDVNSTINPNNYASFTGTSMSCPGVAGTLAQLYHAYKSLNGGTNPPSALIKAAVLNTADDIGNPGPDFRHGWGRINARRAYGVLAASQFVLDSVDQGDNNAHTINIPANVAELRVMVYWHDKEATAGAVKALVNNIDITVTTPTAQTVLPWVLDKTATVTALNSNAVQGVDTLNNMEQVTITNPPAGGYTLNVSGFSVPQGPQQYAVVYEFVEDKITLTYPMGRESLVPGTQETIRWDAYGASGTFTLEYSTDSGTNCTTLSSNVGAALRAYNWTPPATVSGKALVRITRGSNTDVSDTTFSVIGVPSSVVVNWVCIDSLQISYNTVPNATGYIITKLGSNYMDSIGFSTTNTSVVHTSTVTGGWVSVQAVASDGCKGRRALAQSYQAAPFNCALSGDLGLLSLLSPSKESVLHCQGGSLFQSVMLQIKNNSTNPLGNIPLRYKVNNGATVTGTYLPQIAPGDTAVYTFTQLVPFNNAGIYSVKAWLDYSGDPTQTNDTLILEKQVIVPPLATLPAYEDFETFTLCDTFANCESQTCQLTNGWTNLDNTSDDASDWRTHSGQTPTGSVTNTTGPDMDYNPGTAAGKYLYVEASSCYSKAATLVSPCFDLSNVQTAEMSFAYHMFGSDMGQLHVDVRNGNQWLEDVIPALTGDHGNAWEKAVVTLDNFAGQIISIRFRGVTGNGENSDIAIDDIAVTGTSGVGDIDGNDNIKVFPNPSKGNYTVQISGQNQPVTITVADLSGKVIRQEIVVPQNGKVSAAIQLTKEAAGVYILTVKGGDGIVNRKLIKL